MEDKDSIFDERIMTNYDKDEIAPSQTIDFTAFLNSESLRIPPSAYLG